MATASSCPTDAAGRCILWWKPPPTSDILQQSPACHHHSHWFGTNVVLQKYLIDYTAYSPLSIQQYAFRQYEAQDAHQAPVFRWLSRLPQIGQGPISIHLQLWQSTKRRLKPESKWFSKVFVPSAIFYGDHCRQLT